MANNNDNNNDENAAANEPQQPQNQQQENEQGHENDINVQNNVLNNNNINNNIPQQNGIDLEKRRLTTIRNAQLQQDNIPKDIPAGEVMTFTEEQRQRIIRCRTSDDTIVEANWHLLMQCGTFKLMWESLCIEDNFSNDQLACFEFPLNDISEECFLCVLDWMLNHDGVPMPAITHDKITGERNWFKLTEWETEFFKMDFELLKECYLASNFLDLKTLYYYCAQDIARCIMDKEAHEIREMLGLPDDLTDEEKAMIAAEYEYHPTPPPELVEKEEEEKKKRGGDDQHFDESQMQGTSAQFTQQQQQSSSTSSSSGISGSTSTTLSASTNNNAQSSSSSAASSSSSSSSSTTKAMMEQ